MELELAWVCDESNRKFTPVPKQLVTEADAAAKQAAADSDMCVPTHTLAGDFAVQQRTAYCACPKCTASLVASYTICKCRCASMRCAYIGGSSAC